MRPPTGVSALQGHVPEAPTFTQALLRHLVPLPHSALLPHSSIPPTSSSHSPYFSLLATSRAVSPAAFTAQGTKSKLQPYHSFQRPPKPPSQLHTCGEGGFAFQEQLEAVGLVVECTIVQGCISILGHPAQGSPVQGQQWGSQGLRAHKHLVHSSHNVEGQGTLGALGDAPILDDEVHQGKG